jgi:hypothetical protein
MTYDIMVEPDRRLFFDAVEEMNKIPCIRKQPIFTLEPHKYGWELDFVCGTNRGNGSDNGYGIGHTCKTNCKLRIIPTGD